MAEAVINNKIQPKRTKAMDMRFHWLRDRECQQQFRFYWRPGRLNYADYWTKHHSAAHHKNIRREFITPYIVLELLRQEDAKERAEAAEAMCAWESQNDAKQWVTKEYPWIEDVLRAWT